MSIWPQAGGRAVDRITILFSLVVYLIWKALSFCKTLFSVWLKEDLERFLLLALNSSVSVLVGFGKLDTS